MVKAEYARQLMVRAENQVGMLSKITSQITESQINIIAICAYAIDGTVALMLVTDDNNETKKILETQGLQVAEEEVILLSVDNKPGTLQLVTDRLAQEGIDLRLLYGSVDQDAHINCNVLVTNDNLDAMMIIKTEMERS